MKCKVCGHDAEECVDCLIFFRGEKSDFVILDTR